MRNWSSRATCVAAAAITMSVLPVGQTATADTVPEWLTRLNEVRVGSGLSPVTSVPAWNAGLTNHLTYLEHELGGSLMAGSYASWHTENPASTYYTASGATEAGRSNLAYAQPARTEAGYIDMWLTAPFHAIGMLRPRLSQVAFASQQGWAGLDVLGGLTGSSPTSPVLFPGNGARTDLTAYSGGEMPNPMDTCSHLGKSPGFAGLPFVALLPQALPSSGVTGSLRRPDGTTDLTSGPDLCLVYAGNYWSSDTTYGPTGLSILSGDHAALLIPRNRLVDGSYTATLDIPGRSAVVWSFTVGAGNQPPTTMPPTTPPAGTPTIVNRSRPALEGKARVTRTLRAKPGRWQPAAVDFHYRWWRDDTRIRKGTSSTYTLRKADRKHRISVSVRATRAGYDDPGWVRSVPSAQVKRARKH